jgi:monoamine oxidase
VEVGVEVEVEVEVEELKTIKADCVLVTLPLGVLQEGCVKFDPPLPRSVLPI